MGSDPEVPGRPGVLLQGGCLAQVSPALSLFQKPKSHHSLLLPPKTWDCQTFVFVFLYFLGLHTWHVEVSRPGVYSEL